MRLSICIATLPVRYPLLAVLLRNLYGQKTDEVEILTDDSTERTTGMKRRLMYEQAEGDYICSVDDDDEIYPYYVSEILKAVENNPDAVGINGIMTTDGHNEKKWFISMLNPYTAVKRYDGSIVYSRYHNHLSPVKAAIAKQFPFIDSTKYEDYDYAHKMHNSGLIKKEVCIGTTLDKWLRTGIRQPEKPMYHYKFKTNK